jgi:GT2 family glycosyltransferase
MRLLVVIVAYRSQAFLAATVTAVSRQLGRQDTLCLVDNASLSQIEGLRDQLDTKAQILFISSPQNLGFTGGNNLGLEHGRWQNHEAVLLLNPDLILPDAWVSKALSLLSSRSDIGIVSGPLVKYDFASGQPLEVLDSLGIERCGPLRLWKDVGQGQPSKLTLEALPRQWNPSAICGALMLLSRAAVGAVIEEGDLFDRRFFAYKEDIDLCLRIRKAGFNLLIDQQLLAYHGRGWDVRRREVPYSLRCLSARNEVYLHYKHRSPYLPLSMVKAVYVHAIEKFILGRWTR